MISIVNAAFLSVIISEKERERRKREKRREKGREKEKKGKKRGTDKLERIRKYIRIRK